MHMFAKWHFLLIFFDPGAKASFISLELASKLGIRPKEMRYSAKAGLACPGHSEAVTPIIGKLRLHIQSYVDAEEFYIMLLKGCDVLLGIPWMFRVQRIMDLYNKKITVQSKGTTHILDVKLKGESIPTVSTSTITSVMKKHLSAYLVFAHEVSDSDDSNLSVLDKERSMFLQQFSDCFSYSLRGVLEVKVGGSLVSKSVSRRLLLKTSGLRLRDIRSVDPSLWVTNAAPALLIRDQAILLNLGSLRAIASADSVLVFDYKSVGAVAFLDLLLQRLNPDANPGVPAMPFELEVVEAALLSRTQRLERRLMEVEPRVVSLLEVLPNCLTANVLEELRLSKQALVELGSKANALRQMLLELLDSPQEIRRMTIMGRRCTISKEDGSVECMVSTDKQLADDEEEEMEMLLENYLQRCESCHGQAERLLDSAKEMEDSIAVNLSSRRLEVSRLELLLQVGTFCSALGALVAGIFGMNLKSYIEGNAIALVNHCYNCPWRDCAVFFDVQSP
ncbi:hypothetical protein L7F22_052071 [Adiantum nelumboides]|nr:hypothetical protein [Adiantum nelumboides]